MDFVNKRFTIRRTDWPAQLILKNSNNSVLFAVALLRQYKLTTGQVTKNMGYLTKGMTSDVSLIFLNSKNYDVFRPLNFVYNQIWKMQVNYINYISNK